MVASFACFSACSFGSPSSYFSSRRRPLVQTVQCRQRDIIFGRERFYRCDRLWSPPCPCAPRPTFARHCERPRARDTRGGRGEAAWRRRRNLDTVGRYPVRTPPPSPDVGPIRSMVPARYSLSRGARHRKPSRRGRGAAWRVMIGQTCENCGAACLPGVLSLSAIARSRTARQSVRG